MNVWGLSACALLVACAPTPPEAPPSSPADAVAAASDATASSAASPRSEPSSPLELAAIAELIDAAEADMFVRYLGGEAIAEAEVSDQAHFGTYPDPDVSTGALAPYGAHALLGYAEGYPFLLILSATSRAPAQGTPALVWSVAGERATLLTLEGAGRAARTREGPLLRLLRACSLAAAAPALSLPWPRRASPLRPRA